jgi:DNA polymerase III subunit delta'
MHKDFWHELAGQPEAVELMQRAVNDREDGVFHSWLVTGPPGSGRSVLAETFAAALQCSEMGCGSCQSCVLAKAGTHPDITILSTEKVQIAIAEVRDLVASSSFGASTGRYRIMIIEDADRMAPVAANVLLKALEEPPANTIWILCAPSEADMLPTIRSRVRKVTLKVPSVADVAKLLVERDGIDPALATLVAAEAQSHIGMARRLATSSEARDRRHEYLRSALNINSVYQATKTADKWLDLAKKDAAALTKERDEEERQSLLHSLGLAPTESIPNQYRTDIKNLEEGQKRRATRSLRDGLDRILVDLLALYRDVLTVQLNARVELVNRDLEVQIREVAMHSTPDRTLHIIDSIEQARERIDRNVRDLFVMDSLASTMMRVGN